MNLLLEGCAFGGAEEGVEVDMVRGWRCRKGRRVFRGRIKPEDGASGKQQRCSSAIPDSYECFKLLCPGRTFEGGLSKAWQSRVKLLPQIGFLPRLLSEGWRLHFQSSDLE